MGASDYQLGYQAYFAGNSCDRTRSREWQTGWEQAEDDDVHGEATGFFDDDLNWSN